MSDCKRAYRYRVVETGGEGTKAVGDSPTILDWKHLGREYTWNIIGAGFKPVGFIAGEYMDRGYVEDGKYRSDAEIKAGVVSRPSGPRPTKGN